MSNTTHEMRINNLAEKLWAGFISDLDMIQNMQNVILNSKFHISQIISQEEVINVTELIERWEHEYERIPQHQSWHDLINLFDVQSSVSESYFIFKLYLPLVKKESFYVYRKYLVPIHMGIHMGWLNSSEDYFITNKQQNWFIGLNSHDLRACSTHVHFICPKDFYYQKADACDTDLFLDKPSHIYSCQIELKEAKNYVVSTEQAWLFSLTGTEKVHVVCKNNSSIEIELKNSGVLKIDSQCVAKGTNFTIKSLSNQLDHAFPIFKVSEALTNLTIEQVIQQQKIGQIDWKLIKENIHKLKEKEDDTVLHNYHHYTAPYLIGILLLIFFFSKEIISYRKSNNKKNNNKINHNEYFPA